jgi:hypothetical protein
MPTGVRLRSSVVSGEMETRRIPLSLSATEWAELLEEIDQLAAEHRFSVALFEGAAGAGRTDRIGDLISRGYSWGQAEPSGSPILVPQPAGVLYLVSPLRETDDIPTWIAHVPALHFRQHLLAMDIAEEAYAHLASLCAGESWDLDAFMRRGAWAEFIVEFIASREIDLVQVIAARLGVDLAPALRAAYPSIRVVVDVDGEDAAAHTWLTYATSRYGNVIDAFCAPQPATTERLRQEGVSASRVHLWGAGPEEGDRAGAAIHREVYGRLLATSVN